MGWRAFVFGLIVFGLSASVLGQSVLSGQGSLPPPVPRRGGGPQASAAAPPMVDGIAPAPRARVEAESLAPPGASTRAARPEPPSPAVVAAPQVTQPQPAQTRPAQTPTQTVRGGNQLIFVRGSEVDIQLPTQGARRRYGQLQVIGYRMVWPEQSPVELINMLNPTDPSWRQWRPDPRDYIRNRNINRLDAAILETGYCLEVQRQGDVQVEGQRFPRFGVVRFVRPGGCS